MYKDFFRDPEILEELKTMNLNLEYIKMNFSRYFDWATQKINDDLEASPTGVPLLSETLALLNLSNLIQSSIIIIDCQSKINEHLLLRLELLESEISKLKL